MLGIEFMSIFSSIPVDIKAIVNLKSEVVFPNSKSQNPMLLTLCFLQLFG
ncbi:hypothetical protein ADICYQ_0192 [Cyclobacterium qasimii M12-11B]|uniref:Uncharacterized protein n=1 Tax=Cyclobacterium qasimii M12-11B TaxID=641524 RepID=S7WXM1_9BACT|nr:hypothetical protein ADICYQ_0192 [Cyclobacterium qasimii M12-11B]